MSPLPQHDVGALLAESIRALAIAWRNISAYPSDHPALGVSLDNAHRRVNEIAAPAGRLVLGVGPDSLVYGEEKLKTPQAQKLGQALYRRNVALLTIEEGLEREELESFLRLLGEELGPPEKAPLWDEIAAAGVRHVHLQPVDYSSVSLTQELEERSEEKEEPGSLWDGILRALLAGKTISAEGVDLRSPDLRSAAGIGALIARYVQEEAAAAGGPGTPAAEGGGGTGVGSGTGTGAGSGTGADVGAGRSLSATLATQIAGAVGAYLGRTGGHARLISSQQVTELVRSLPLQVRETVVMAAIRAVSSDEADAEALRMLSSLLSPDAVLRCLRRLSAEGSRLSSHALRLAQALAPPPKPQASEEAAPEELASLVSQVRTLYREEDIDRLNPEDQSALFDRVLVELEEFAQHEPVPVAELGDRLDSLTDDALAERLAFTLVELLGQPALRDGLASVLGRLEGLFRLFVSGSRLEPAVGIVETVHKVIAAPQCPRELRAALQEWLLRLASQESITTLVEVLHSLPEDRVGLVRRLIDLLGAAAARNFLFNLSEETNRSRRRRLFNLLSSLGPVIVNSAMDLLSDNRWYVVRNMIVLLRAVGDHSSLPELRRCARHPDLRVRLEAIKSLFSFDADVPGELLDAAIHEADPKLAEAAIALSGQYRITQAVDPLLDILSRWDLFGRRRSVRLKALRALGDLADPVALERLGRFFRERRFFHTVAIEERRAAYRTLESYPAAARRPRVERGLASRDAEIRRICERLSATPETVAPPPEDEAAPPPPLEPPGQAPEDEA